MKKFTSLLLVMMFLVSFGAVGATENLVVDPLSSDKFAYCSSSILVTSSGSVEASSTHQAFGVYNLSVKTELQRYTGSSWVTVAQWTEGRYGSYVGVVGNHSPSGGLYRVKGTHSIGSEVRVSYSPNLNV